ncbi:MAG: malonic semialdehyde reductase [Gammaproteobacteria bacterium]|jgi:3-hydroxypropanoate dehydrogenase
MKKRLDASALDQLFREARSYPSWDSRPVPDAMLRELYALTITGPTSMNCLPARFVFIRSTEGKAKLLPAIAAGNVDKVGEAPVTVIVAHDTRFHDHMAQLWPHNPGAGEMFAHNSALSDTTAFRNATLQGAYMILAARALGLDVGPMSGFDNEKLDAIFFPDGHYRSNFLMNIGFGDDSGLHPRGPRLDFDQAATLA